MEPQRPPTATNQPFKPWVATWSVAALALGFLLGFVGRLADLPAVGVLSQWIAPLGVLWMSALEMTVVPLVVSQLLAAMVLPKGSRPFGALGGQAVALFIVLSVCASLVAGGFTAGVLQFFEPPQDLLASLPSPDVPAAAREAVSAPSAEGLDWLVGLVPRNPLEAAVNGNLLQVLVFTIILGVAAAHLPDERRDPLAVVFRSLADAMMILVGWILWGTPVGVFSIVLSLTLGAGWGVLGLVVLFFLMVCGALIMVTAGLYPVTVFFGGVSFSAFARGAFPSQPVAATTQSSLASLPAMIEGGKQELNLPERATGFVLPLWVSAFKINQAVSPMVKVLFLAHFFRIHLSAGDLGAFVVGSILIGLTSVGVPRGGALFNRLPLYLAVGIPIEVYFVVEAVKHSPIYDACATVLNVTGDMTAATVLTRRDRMTGLEYS